MNLAIYCTVITITFVMTHGEKTKQPNIVLIIADDMGWDDISLHGSNQVLTPNIDWLGATGLAMGRYYTHAVCTPSRASLLTGKFAHTIGMQGYPLTNGEDRAVPASEKLLPEYLKQAGYATHLVGKWHVGHARSHHLPTARGFDSHFGHRGGYVDYYEYVLEEMWDGFGDVSGFDMYNNSEVAWSTEGYLTDVYTKEAKSVIRRHLASTPLFLMVGHCAPHAGNRAAALQAPAVDVRAARYVASPARRIYTAMVKKLDDSVGEIIEALHEKDMLSNTIIVFISDNGGMTSGDTANYASNWPLRGVKMTPFEGAIRVPGIIWNPIAEFTSNVWDGYFHVVDWLPTLLGLAGINFNQPIDGLNLWDSMVFNSSSSRKEIFEINDHAGYSSIISGDYKLVTGSVKRSASNHHGKNLRGYIGNPPSYRDALVRSKAYKYIRKNEQIDVEKLRNVIKIKCELQSENQSGCYPNNGKWCLFNIQDEPCERRDLSETQAALARELGTRLESEMRRLKPRTYPIWRDPRALPRLHNYTWFTWADKL